MDPTASRGEECTAKLGHLQVDSTGQQAQGAAGPGRRSEAPLVLGAGLAAHPRPRPRMVAMPTPPHSDSDDCFHCPQGNKPCPQTYQPGAWLAQLPAEPPPGTPDRPHRSDEIEATYQEALRKVREAVARGSRR